MLFRIRILPPFFVLSTLLGLPSALIAAPSLSEITLSRSVRIPEENKEVFYFQIGLTQMRQQKYNEAAKNFQLALDQKGSLEDYITFNMAQNADKNNDQKGAEELFKKVDKLKPNLRLRSESRRSLARLLIDRQEYKRARDLLLPLERQFRGADENAPVILYQLALTDKGLKKTTYFCRWIRRLYSQHPLFEPIKAWGPILHDNLFEGEATTCSSDDKDFQIRIQNLSTLGAEVRAREEISQVQKHSQARDPVQADLILARYFLQQGEASKALMALKKHFQIQRDNIDYLLTYAVAAARSGQGAVAVGAYYQAHRMAPKSQKGRTALYQAAFLSYQNQDYDGASRKYLEFVKKYGSRENPRRRPSGLLLESQWSLAWLKYLRGHYAGALESFSLIAKPTSGKKIERPSPLSERAQYWMAMSLLRLSRSKEALVFFERLSQDPSRGYYSLAARARLNQLQSRRLASPESTQLGLRYPSLTPFGLDQKPDQSLNLSLAYRVDLEDQIDLTDPSRSPESISELGSNHEEDRNENESEPLAEAPVDLGDLMQSNGFASRLQKAKDLLAVGLDGWAKWDLYEIERKTRNKDILRTLITRYSELKNYHRSSYIAQVYFSDPNSSSISESLSFLWESSFPQAYSEEVKTFSKRYDVPSTFIWGIMRAESRYRQDAMSPAGALGLMQIMPRTARRMSEKLGIKNFSSEQLLDPPMSINIGTAYLKRLLGQFNQSAPLAAAAYNAGPHRVVSWIRSFGSLQLDEFIEHIPFQETRNYVKKVVSNQQAYSQLYKIEQSSLPSLSLNLEVNIPDHLTSAQESWD